MKIVRVIAALAGFVFCFSIKAQIYDTNNVSVQTFAGYGVPGLVDGTGQLTAFSAPAQIVSDTASNLYVWDSGNYRIRKITAAGVVSTIAGGGTLFEGYGTNVSLSWYTMGTIAMDHNNTLWMVMSQNYGGYGYLLTLDTNGYISIQNGGLTNLNQYSGVCFDSQNNLYYSGGNRIYKYNPTTRVSVPFAGNGYSGNFDGQGPIFSAFANPAALACDQADNIYVWDSGNQTIRRVDQGQNVTTIAGATSYYGMVDGTGTNAAMNGISSMFSDNAGNIYLVCGSCIRKMDAQTNVVTEAGNFNTYSGGFANGTGATARFYNASGGCFSQGMLFVADAGNNRIRSISFGAPPQVVAPADLQLRTYAGVQINGWVGRTYQVQASANMTNWNTVATVLLTSSPYLWIDSSPVAGHQFYRAVMLP